MSCSTGTSGTIRSASVRCCAGPNRARRWVFEAAYEWGWLAELIDEMGFESHLAHARSCKAIAHARLKNDRVTYAVFMRTLYMTTSGLSDPTRASIPLHLAVNGSLEVGHTVGVVLAGDATEMAKADIRERLEGLGVPPLRDLLAKARAHEVPVYV